MGPVTTTIPPGAGVGTPAPNTGNTGGVSGGSATGY
jgi:hypothetical protein